MKQKHLDDLIEKNIKAAGSNLFATETAATKGQSSLHTSPEAARKAAIKILARREYSQYELQQKLKPYYDSAVILEVINKLVQDDWQSDERFAFMWTRARAARGCGPVRITQELKQKGIEEALIEQALAQEELNWCEIAQAVYIKKYGASPPSDWPERAKRLKFMQYRGFSQAYYGL